jgi:beta-galactosidase
LSKHANQYRTERGWFGDARWTLKDLPVGAQKLAGVSYDIYDFPTSPVPTCIMLAGPKVPGQLPAQVTGIPVNRRADALFFLHTARIDRRRNEKEKKDGQQHEIVRYVIRYADGRDEVLPIYSELDIDDYRVKQPQALPGAQLAWTRPYEGTEFHAAVYAKQWTNPRPEVEIRSLDIVSGDSDRGTAALLAVTAASVP